MSDTDTDRTPIEAPRRLPVALVIDDEADLRELLSLTLVRLGLDVDSADSMAQARERLARKRYNLALTDMRLPDGVGLDLVREVAQGQYREPIPIVVITAFGSPENAVAALKAGAFDYLTKPVDLEQLRLVVRSALKSGHETLVGGTPLPAFSRLQGASPAMQQLRALIDKLARSMAPVAIRGESGSGKELVARAIHELSSRAGGPFVAVNCGAIPETLMEAEFFGYRKGAFTGADRDRGGFFQAAAGGTLFQERRVRKVGATAEEPVDVRLLSATHQDLAKQVVAGRFRQDLYYRLNVIELRVPSLRERAEDIPLIAEYLLHRLAERVDGKPARLSPEALAALQRHPFPGNVRELENVLERALALAAADELQPLDLMLPQAEIDLLLEPEDLDSTAAARESGADADAAAAAGLTEAAAAEWADDRGAAAPAPTFSVVDGVPNDLQAYLDALEREAIRAAVARTRNNRTAAAQLLGLTFRQLRYRMQRLGLR
jgi:two-component system response regulator PilR (NtrC family)